jgi:hypothetical protein
MIAFRSGLLFDRWSWPIIQPLLTRRDLALLTMLPWSAVFPERGLLQRTKRWCPLCYRGWLSQHRPIYDPLIWSLRPIRACVHHHIPLREVCPTCHTEAPWLSGHSIPGYCTSCGSPLWDVPSADGGTEVLDPKEWQWQRWASDHIGALLSLAGVQSDYATAERVSALYTRSTETLFAGNMSEAARLHQVSRRTMRE